MDPKRTRENQSSRISDKITHKEIDSIPTSERSLPNVNTGTPAQNALVSPPLRFTLWLFWWGPLFVPIGGEKVGK